MGLLTSLHIGSRGLGAASAGIAVTSQNVTNANTAGYARRRLDQTTMDPVRRGALWLGQGVSLSNIHRASDRLLGARYVQATGDNAYASSLESALKVTEGYFDETQSVGLVEAYDSFFDSLTSASADPSDTSLRQEVLAQAGALANVVSTTAAGLESTLDGFDDTISTGLDSLNEKLQEIASLNDAIAAGGGSVPDLEDRRGELILDVSEAIGATAEFRADGQAVLYVGGHAIVSGGEARTLSTELDAAGTPQIYVSADAGAIRVTDELGGTVGGTVAAREKTRGYLDTLDEFAFTFATAMNAQSAAGYDEAGAAGGDVFTVSGVVDGAAASLRLDATLADDPDRLAFAGDPTAAAGDGDNLAALRALGEDDTLFAAGTGHDLLSRLEATVGGDVATATADVDATGAVLSDLGAVRDAISGVDTDEEAVRLIEYQTAYRAASGVISAVDGLLEELMNLGR